MPASRPSRPARAESRGGAIRGAAMGGRGRRVRLRAKQRGLALVLLLAIVMMSALYMLVSQLSRAAQRVDRDIVTAGVLAEARQALIGHAARERRLRPLTPTSATPPHYAAATIATYGTSGLNIEVNDRPGSLPCPAADEDGIALPADACASWSTAGAGVWKNRVGWLPWRTLGIPPLRDADGNLLWYAVSDSVRNGNLNSGGPLLILNSDSVHRAAPDPFAFRPLTVQGTTPAQNVVAVVIAPGQALPGQDRAGARYSVRSWLEGENNYLDNDAGATSDDVFETRLASPAFNDTLVSLTAADLFSVVENAVALRMQRTIVPLLAEYHANWNAQPYPAAFDADKARTDFAGAVPGTLPITATSVIAGQLPLLRTDDVQWGAITVKQLVNPAYGAYDSTIHEQDATIPLAEGPDGGHTVGFAAPTASACAATVIANAPDTLDCTVYHSGEPWVKITAHVPAGARGLVKAQLIPPLPALPVAMSGPSDQDGSTTMIYRTRLAPAGGSTVLQFSAFPTLKLDSPGGDTAWFVRNEWYRLVQYAVAPGAAPGKPGPVADCTSAAPATCLDARRANGTVEFSRAVLVLAGSKSFKTGPAAQLRQDEAGAATTDPANYFEAANLTTDLQYEERRRANQPTAAFNDRLAGYRAP